MTYYLISIFGEEYEDPEIQVAIDKGKIVNILYDSGR